MTIEQPGDDEWGAEAMPGGLAEMQRALQPADSAVVSDQPSAERRDSDRAGYSGRRKQPAGPPD
ncbi:MAG TPA: hypothetical protein VGO84_06885 [Burkholderiales bacterium]|jgi:hypothetical protein|nr:hypothetical protein [Burkholderiales bacterium]